MADNLPPHELFDFVTGDFVDAWEHLARDPAKTVHRGNFMFARQAMTLLELACRLCFSDKTGEAMRAFSAELARIDSRYFLELPGDCWSAGRSPQFFLPALGSSCTKTLLAALFDSIRNGQAHQYQQISIALTDGRHFYFGLTGAEGPLAVAMLVRPPQHLALISPPGADLLMAVRSDVLFLDFRQAFLSAKLLDRGLSLDYLARGGSARGTSYQFAGAALEELLRGNGH